MKTSYKKETIERRTYQLDALKGGVQDLVADVTAEGFEFINHYQKWSGPHLDPKSRLVNVLIFEKVTLENEI